MRLLDIYFYIPCKLAWFFLKNKSYAAQDFGVLMFLTLWNIAFAVSLSLAGILLL